MELKTLLRQYRKGAKMSVRKFAEVLGVSHYRLEKWEKGIHPNNEDAAAIRAFFGLREFQKISENFLETFEPVKSEEKPVEDLIKLKNQLLEEKDKRIRGLEETIMILREAQAEYVTKKKS